MPYCPKCLVEYETGVERCADCDTPLVPELPTDAHLQSQDLEVVYTCSDLIEAELIKANLESVEIDVTVLVQKDNNFPAVGDFAIIKLFVPKTQVEAAKNYLENTAAEETSSEVPEE